MSTRQCANQRSSDNIDPLAAGHLPMARPSGDAALLSVTCTWAEQLSQQPAAGATLDDRAGRHADAQRRHAPTQPVPRQRPAAALRRVAARPIAARPHLSADAYACCRVISLTVRKAVHATCYVS